MIGSSVGQAITTKEIEDLPLSVRTTLLPASLSMAVIATGQPSLIHPFSWDGHLAYSPPADAVQEVRVKACDTTTG